MCIQKFYAFRQKVLGGTKINLVNVPGLSKVIYKAATDQTYRNPSATQHDYTKSTCAKCIYIYIYIGY